MSSRTIDSRPRPAQSSGGSVPLRGRRPAARRPPAGRARTGAMRATLPSGPPVEICTPGDGRPPSRGLVLIPDIMGMRPLFDDHAQRLADDNGWAVAAVEPWPGRETMPLDERMHAVGTIDDAALL